MGVNDLGVVFEFKLIFFQPTLDGCNVLTFSLEVVDSVDVICKLSRVLSFMISLTVVL